MKPVLLSVVLAFAIKTIGYGQTIYIVPRSGLDQSYNIQQFHYNQQLDAYRDMMQRQMNLDNINRDAQQQEQAAEFQAKLRLAEQQLYIERRQLELKQMEERAAHQKQKKHKKE
jgi:capsular polysaccharide biosynthesis protein